MSKFVIECPKCGKYAEGHTGFFARKKIDCTCGHTINVRTDRYTARECPYCGNTVLFDQTKGEKAKCPVCGENINTKDEQNKIVEITCAQCGVRLNVDKTAKTHVCPVCDNVNNVQEIIVREKNSAEGGASIVKYEGPADSLIWKHPIEDFNFGSQLIVHESQEALFFRDGQAADSFKAGRYTLETNRMPIMERLCRFSIDDRSTFHSEVYFVNLVTQLAIKWGTPEKISFIDPSSESPMTIGARGILNLRVKDSRNFLLKLVGTGSGLSRQQLIEDGNSTIKNYFKSIIQVAVSTKLANVITEEKIDILQLDQQKIRLSEIMLPMIQPYFDDYGLEVSELLLEGIILPQRGEIGYDALQTLIKLRQKKLTMTALDMETEIKMAEMDAKKTLDIHANQNATEVELSHREVVAQKGETSVLETKIAGQKKLEETSADVAAERMRMQLEMERKLQNAQIEGEEMRLKGYTQRDVINAEVQQTYAASIGAMGAFSPGGGIASQIMGVGIGVAAANSVAPQINNIMGGLGQQNPAANNANGWDCACGQRNISTNFCPNCGAKKPEPKAGNTWDCVCGQKSITTNFCPNCGAKKPEAPKTWDCVCGQKGITTNFCPNCGAKKPEAPSTWICPDCGTRDITTNFCPQCGRKRD